MCYVPGGSGVGGLASGPVLVGGMKGLAKSGGFDPFLVVRVFVVVMVWVYLLLLAGYYGEQWSDPLYYYAVWFATAIALYILCCKEPLIAWAFRFLGLMSLPFTLFYGIVFAIAGHPDNPATLMAPFFLSYSVLVIAYLYFVKPSKI